MLLTVFNAHVQDIGKSIARIHLDVMESIGASDGDIIEIIGQKRTVSRIQKLDLSDVNKGMIRIDGLAQHNLGVIVGNTVSVRKVKAVAAQKIVVAPLESIPPIDDRYLVDALDNLPFVKGDHTTVQYCGGKLAFQVVEITPLAEAVFVTQKTLFSIEKYPMGVSRKEQPNTNDKDIFDKHVSEQDKEKIGIPKDALLLGYSNFILYITKDGKLDFGLSGGGYWPDEMKPHMDDPLIQALRNFHYEYRKKLNARFGESSFKTREFDYEI